MMLSSEKSNTQFSLENFQILLSLPQFLFDFTCVERESMGFPLKHKYELIEFNFANARDLQSKSTIS